MEEADGAGRPVDVRRRAVGVKRLGQEAVVQSHHHLDDTTDTCGSLGMAEVGLEATEPERLVGGMGGAVGGEEGLGLDGVAESGAGAVGFDDVDVGRGEAGTVEGLDE